MVISDKVIYLELQKTGCSHVRKLLTSIPEYNGKILGKHNTIYEVPLSAIGDVSSKLKVGNIRNPWDWYVSLWAFGTTGNGGLVNHIINKSFVKKLKNPQYFFIPVNLWKSVYADATNPELFRQWIKMILNSKRRRDMGKGYGISSMSSFSGLLTYRYMRLYTYDFDKDNGSIGNYDQLKSFDERKNMLDYIIRNENLENDFKVLMERLDMPGEAVSKVIHSGKTNASPREDYHKYYDDETIQLIWEKEKLIIEKYQYCY